MMTLKDIAKETGFSTITVSRVVHNPDKVKLKTRKIIEEAIKKHNYVPNRLAQGLVYKRTNIIYLFIASDLETTHPFVMQVMSGIIDYLGNYGYSVLLRREWYEHQPCDGIVLIGLTMQDEENISTLSKEKQIVLFGHHGLEDWIDVDNYNGSRLMTEYVIKKGYKDLAYIGIKQDKKYTIDRLKGHLLALKDNGFNHRNAVVSLVDNKEVCGYLAALDLLNQNPKTEVLICASDYLAIGAMRAATHLGIKVPEQLGITGYDGLGFEYLTTPNLTTVKQPIYEIGQLLAKRILEKIEYGQTFKGEYVLPTLIEKESLR